MLKTLNDLAFFKSDFFTKKFFYCLILSNLIFLSFFILRHNGNFQQIELSVYDAFLRLMPYYKMESPVVLIGANEADFRDYGWPITDEILGKLILKIASGNPSVIGVDLYRDRKIEPGSEILDRAFEIQNVIGIMKLGKSAANTVYSHPVLKKKDAFGLADIPVDDDGLVRRGLLYLDDGKDMYTSFALKLALIHLSKKEIFPKPSSINPDFLEIGKTVFIPLEKDTGPYKDADAGGYQYLIDFRHDLSQIKTYSFSDVLDEKAPPGFFSDKIIIIGVAAESVKDIFFIPPNKNKIFAEINTYGISLHALMTNQIINLANGLTQPVNSLGELNESIFLWLFCIAGGLLGFYLRSFFGFSFAGLSGIAIIFFISYFQLKENLFIPVVIYIFGWTSSMALVTSYMSYQEKTDRLVLMQLFSRHVSSGVANLIWKNRDQFLINGRLRPLHLMATVFFSDIKGFTSISEKIEPDVLMDWLNEYMKAMSDIVMENGGTIDKYIGDAIMAVFGFPIMPNNTDEIKKDAVNAINCAIKMEKELSRLNKNWSEKGLPQIKSRIGIYTGKVLAGSLGSEKRLEYTVIGDTVNIASRMESFPDNENIVNLEDKTCRILIGESTYKLIETNFTTKEIGEALLKGKKKSVKVFQILD